MQKLLFSALVLCLFIAACKKTDIPTDTNDPVFMVFIEDSIGTTITAGLDGIYHFTGFKVQDSTAYSVNTFSDVHCPVGDCPGSLSFEFRQLLSQNSAFLSGSYLYILPDSIVSTSSFYRTIFSWDDAIDIFPERTFSILGNNPESYSVPDSVRKDLPDVPIVVQLEGFGGNGMISKTTRTILPSNKAAYPGVSITTEPEGDGYIFTAVQDPLGAAIVKYVWNTGDSTASITTDSFFIGQLFQVTAFDQQGNTATASLFSLPYPPVAGIRTATLRYSTKLIDVPFMENVAIQWVDQQGTTWRSDRAKQPLDSSFEILENTPYEANERGDKVQKLRVQFSCLLYNSDGAFKPFTGFGVIGMARP